MKHAIEVVFRKELTDGRRDKRALLSAFIFPIMAPVLVYFLLNAIISLQADETKLVVPIAGMEAAPDLVNWLLEHNVEIVPFSGNAKSAVADKNQEFVLVIPENYQENMLALDNIYLQLVNDGSRNDAQMSVRRIRQLLYAYSQEIGSLRLIARGVSPEIARVYILDDIDIASKQERAAKALNFIPLYIIMAAFVSGMGIAVDSTAGERERKTLEPLILNPVKRHHIVIGKWLAASVFASVGMIFTLVLCVQTMDYVPLDKIGLTFESSFSQVLLMILAMLPLAFLATSLQLLLGIFAKSFKDAQSYIGILMVLPVMPMMYTTFNPVLTQDWMFLVPIFGQQLMLVDVLGGSSVAPIAYVYSFLGCLVLGLCLVMVTARLFQRESIIQ